MIVFLAGMPGFSNDIKKSIEVYIIQDGKETKASANTAIKKKEFSLKFVLYDKPTIKVNISDKDYIYKAALNKIDQFYLFPFFAGCSFAENNLNQDKDFILSNDANHYWYYEDKTDSRFDSVKIDGNKFTCIRTVKSIYNRETKESVDISKIKHSELYFTVLAYSGQSFNRDINFNEILNDSGSKYYSFIKWGLDNEFIDSST